MKYMLVCHRCDLQASAFSVGVNAVCGLVLHSYYHFCATGSPASPSEQYAQAWRHLQRRIEQLEYISVGQHADRLWSNQQLQTWHQTYSQHMAKFAGLTLGHQDCCVAIRFWQAVRKWAQVNFPFLLQTLNPGLKPDVRCPLQPVCPDTIVQHATAPRWQLIPGPGCTCAPCRAFGSALQHV